MKFVKCAALLAALFLAACSSQPMPASVAPSSAGAGPIRGIDMATDSSDVAAELQGRRWLNFVARYYRDPTSRWPALSASEAQRLSAAGVKIVTVWEWHSTEPEYFSYATGYTDATAAYRQARVIGQPPGSAIYFAVDFNARGAALYQIDQYFRGVNAAFAAAGGGRSPYRIGVYGSGAVCTQIKGAGLAQYAWLSGSTSWDGSAGYTAWNIKQAPAGERFGNLSFNHDANEAMADYGGFRLGYADNPGGMVVTAAAQAPVAAAELVHSAVAAVVPKAEAAAPPPSRPEIAAVAPPPAPRVALAAPRTTPLPAAPPPASRIASAAPLLTPPSAVPMAVQTASAAAKPADAGVMDLASLEAGDRHRTTAEPEARAPEHSAKREGVSHDRTPAHAAKALAGPKRRDYAIPTSKRVASIAPHHPGGSSHAELHERGRQLSEPRRAEDHGSHLQAGRAGAVPVLHRPARGSVEQRGPERSHGARRVSG